MGPAAEARRSECDWSVKSAIRDLRWRCIKVGWSVKSAIMGPAIEVYQSRLVGEVGDKGCGGGKA